MSKREYRITTSKPLKEAVKEACEALNARPDNVDIQQQPDGTLTAKVKNAPAYISFEISENGMEVIVTEYLPPVGNGAKLAEDAIANSLKAAGVVYGIDEKAIEKVMAMIDIDHDVRGIVLASGKEPTAKTGDRININGNINYPYLPGDLVCSIEKGKDPEEGFTVKGEKLPPLETSHDVKDNEIIPREGIDLAADKMSATSAFYGLCTIESDKIGVKPVFKVSDDKLEVTGRIYDSDARGEPINIQRLQKAFEDMKFVYGFQADNVTTAFAGLLEKPAEDELYDLEKGKKEKPIKSNYVDDIIILKGTPPIKGNDARLELFYESSSEQKVADDGKNVDHHERNSIRNVKAGQQLATIIPAEKGTPGKNVYGEEIAAEDGEELAVQPGENVSISTDGTKFISDIDGILLYKTDKMSVTDILEIKGDVDFNSGNVHIDKGSVLITGTIRTDFIVDVADSIIVGEAIEGAEVTAGGDVEVKRGIVMHEKGTVDAGGNISALFAENATLIAGGNVDIANDISNCNVNAEGKVIVTRGKGKVMGGIISARNGMETNEIGSEMGVLTQIYIGGEPESAGELQEEKRKLKDSIAKIERVIGNAEPQVILKNTPPAKRKAVAEVLKAKMAALTRMKDIDDIIHDIMKKYKESLKCTLNVYKEIHPGVKIFIGGEHLHITKTTSRCSIYYDAVNSVIRIGSLPS